MRRKLDGEKVVVATHNPGKLAEIEELLRGHGVDTVAAAELGISELEETEASFAGNARLKANHCTRTSGLPALADDSGLCVDALDGAPGVHSARWAGEEKNFYRAMQRIEKEISARRDFASAARNAHFICALCLAWPDGHGEIYEGRVDGNLVWPPRGDNGFGYDPIFVPEGFKQTFGEMEPDMKHRMSHRARAFAKLVDALF